MRVAQSMMARKGDDSTMEMPAGPLALLLAAWMAQAGAATLLCWWYLHLLRRPQPAAATMPPILVLVPVRGPLRDLGAFLSALESQTYPGDWRVVLALEDADDPAHDTVAGFVARNPARASLVLAGPATIRGQKVQNLLAGLAALRPGDGAVVTLDADMVPPPDLLSRLLRPVLSGQAPVASGYRWTLPGDGGLGSALVALADMGVATLPRCARCNLCWGGATAIGRAALDRLDLPRVWDRAVSDDLMLTRAAREAGLTIYAPLDVRPAAPVAFPRLRDALGFGARQYRVLRLHAPRAYLLALLAAAVPVAGGLAALLALAAGGGAMALACLGLAVALQRVRAALRRAIAARILPPDAAVPACLPAGRAGRAAPGLGRAALRVGPGGPRVLGRARPSRIRAGRARTGTPPDGPALILRKDAAPAAPLVSPP